MRKRLIHLVLFLSIFSMFARPAFSIGLGVTGHAGTLGLGGSLSAQLAPKVNARVGFNLFSYSYETTQDDVDYDADLTLRSMALLLDLFPAPGRGFRVSGGLLVNGNGADLTAVPTGSYTIGSITYPAEQIGTLSGNVDLGSVTPYLGIGWGNAVTSRIGFVFDVGVVFQGAPDVTLSATGPISLTPGFQEDLQAEEESIEDDIDQYQYYPVISAGISFALPAF